MAATTSAILGGVGAVSGLLGGMGGGETQSTPTSGYSTYPQWLKDLYEKSFAPAALEEFEKEYEAIPMTRYESVDPFFGSAQLSALQRMSDQQGGMFGPYVDPNAPVEEAPAPVDNTQQMADMEARMLAREYLNQAGGTMSQPRSTNTGQARAQGYMQSGLLNDESLGAIGNYYAELNKYGIGEAAGQDLINRDNPDIMNAYLNAINVQPQVEAYKRKGLIS